MSGDEFDLSGCSAMVTGAASGLGRAIAIGLAGRGMRVAVLDRDGPGAERVAAELGGEAIAVIADVREEAELASAMTTIGDRFGGLQLLVNNAGAGFGEGVHPEQLSRAVWEATLVTNLTAVFLCSREAARLMIPAGGGSIVNIASIAGMGALGRGRPAYGVSKAGVIHLTRELAVAWARHRIRVNAILPCQIRTPPLQALMDDPAYAGQLAHMLEGIPMGRFAEPEELVGAVVFLAADASRMVTGVALPVDGGNLALNAGGIHDWEPIRPPAM